MNVRITRNEVKGRIIEKVYIEGATFFINRNGFGCNFAGDPNRDAFKSPVRKAQIVISEEAAKELLANGINAKILGEPTPEHPEPLCITTIKLNYDYWKAPRVYLVTGGQPSLLNEETVEAIDNSSIKEVNVVAVTRENDKGLKTLWIETMYCVVDEFDDPWAGRYTADAIQDDEEPLPF